MNWLTAPTPLIIAHRGASKSQPENTLAAFAQAIEEGAPAVELDVHLSADGVPVVIHDGDVGRTTNGTGQVAKLTIAELKTLDAGQGQTIPTLDDLFLTFGPALLYNVEIKVASRRGAEAAILDRIESYHLQNNVLISSFYPQVLRRCRTLVGQTIPLAFLHNKSWQRWLAPLLRVEAVHPHYRLVDEHYMTWARHRNYRVNVWTVDDPAEAKRLVELGVDGIVTNVPAAMRHLAP